MGDVPFLEDLASLGAALDYPVTEVRDDPESVDAPLGATALVLSPLACCSCGRSKEQHYECCWDSRTPRYQDDRNGDIQKANCTESTGAQ